MILKDKTFRDGVSQQDRKLPALELNYVGIEERSVKDLLKFVLKFAEQLKFYNNSNHPEGNWKLFFGGDQIADHGRDNEGLTDDEKQYLTEMADYLENPDRYAGDQQKLTLYSAPHRVLLLACLKLLEYARQQFTDLTRRHLDYYYRDVLRLTEKPALPDRVHVAFELADGETEHLLEQSTLLDGGQDSSGKPRQYSLDDDVVVNRAALARVHTLHIQREIVDLKSPLSKRIQVQRLIPRTVFARGNIDFPDSFSTFGETSQSLADAGANTKSYHLGFAVSSPLLLLKEGKRIIHLNFTFKNRLNTETGNALTGGLRVDFTGGANLPWFVAEREDIETDFSVSGQRLTLKITLKESAPAMLAPVADTSTFSLVQPLTSPYPVIRLSVKDIIEDGITENNLYYTKLQDLQLQQLTLDVSVGDGIGTGVQNLAVRNDHHVLNTKSAFAPFGHNPHHLAGFYIANDEISQKRLQEITFHLKWINLPGSFNSETGHYQGYKNINGEIIEVADDDFEAGLKVFDNRKVSSIEPEKLFNSETREATLNSTSSISYNFAPLPEDCHDMDLANAESDDPFDWDRYFKLELAGTNSTFLQDAYVVALQNLGAREKINQPYIPQLRQVSVDYSCTSTVDFTKAGQSGVPIQVLQIHPFGQVELLKTDLLTDKHGDHARYFLLPQYSENGHLYIGIQDLRDKQELPLLFQMDEGNENSDLEPPEVSWNYLSNDNWIKFNDEEFVSDSTNGMLNTGIIRFHPPSLLDATESHPPATTSNSLMPNGFHWFEARVPDNVNAFPAGIAIIPQAASATHLLQTPASEHLNEALPAHSITKLVTPVSALDTVKQPYSSFGGKGQEDYVQFIRRVSERLRHKDRAITMEDYERLVLEQFPAIYKVKCLNQTAQENDPGAAKVKLVVIPNLAGQTPFFSLQPRASQKLRRQITGYLKERVSPFVDVDVVNPRYEEIKYRVTLKFKQKESEGFYLRQLNQDIISYLSPRDYSNKTGLTFGGAIHLSALIRFITNLSYVDFIGNVKLIDHVLINRDSEGFVGRQQLYPLDQDVVETRFPDSILVSSANHFIDLVTDEFEAIQFSGIGYMAVDVDFIVT